MESQLTTSIHAVQPCHAMPCHAVLPWTVVSAEVARMVVVVHTGGGVVYMGGGTSYTYHIHHIYDIIIGSLNGNDSPRLGLLNICVDHNC